MDEHFVSHLALGHSFVKRLRIKLPNTLFKAHMLVSPDNENSPGKGKNLQKVKDINKT
jgi:pentose-5-phosphate-3-epimerase